MAYKLCITRWIRPVRQSFQPEPFRTLLPQSQEKICQESVPREKRIRMRIRMFIIIKLLHEGNRLLFIIGPSPVKTRSSYFWPIVEPSPQLIYQLTESGHTRILRQRDGFHPARCVL